MPSLPPPAFAHPGPPPDPPELPEGAPRPVQRTGAGAERWPPWTAPVALVAGFGATIFAGVIVSIVSGAAGGSLEDPPPGVNIGLTYFQDIALVVAALAFAWMTTRPRAADFGLRRPRTLRAIGLLVAVWVAFFAFSALWAALLNLDQTEDLPDQLGADSSTAALVLVLILVTVMAPIAEELFFRGYFFRALCNWRGMWTAAVITGLVFGAIHIGSSPIGFTVPLAAFGFGLCLLYQWSGSLLPCIALHALNNSLAFGVTQDWTWQIPVTMAASVAVTLTLAGAIGRALGPAGPGRFRAAPA